MSRPVSRTVLVVEDDPAMRDLFALWLTADGFDVRTVSDGREALRYLQAEVPCAMVVDLCMPVMDGAALRRAQQAIPELSHVPFILVSGEQNVARIASDLGIEDVVPKPVDADRLSRIIALRCPHLPL
jgi:CheY-like chemotaxis protein